MKWLGLLLIQVFTINSFAQIRRLDEVFDGVSKTPVESVYLHFDKYACPTGDTLWWKAYVFEDNHSSSISTNLYVELFNELGHRVVQKLYPILKSESIGQIELADSLTSGNYWIRAYTQYQTNFDSTRYFMAPITIYNRKEREELTIKRRATINTYPVVSNIDSSFFWITTWSSTGVDCRFESDSSSLLLNKTINLVLAAYHHPLFKATFTLTGTKSNTTVSFPSKDLHGHVDLLLLDDSGILARQSISLPVQQPSVVITADTLDETTHGFNSWTVHSADSILYNVSVSVADAARTSSPSMNMLDAIPPDPLDYEMAWKGIFPTIRRIDTTFLQWSGLVRKESGKLIRNGEMIALISKDTASSQETRLIRIDSLGRFVLDNCFFFDTAMVGFQLNNHTGNDDSRDIKLFFDTTRAPFFSPPIGALWQNVALHRDTSSLTADIPPPGVAVKELPKFTVKGRSDPRKELDERYASGMFSVPTPYSFDVRTDKSVTSVWEYLRKKLPGFDGGLDVGRVPTLNGRRVIFFVNDEIQSLSDLQLYWYEEIAYIKAFNSFQIDNTGYQKFKTKFSGLTLDESGVMEENSDTLQGLPHGLGQQSQLPKLQLKIPPRQFDPPVVCLYTRKGADIRTAWPGLHQKPLSGYSSIAKFTNTQQNRITLYWEPLAQIGSSHNFHIRFNNEGRVQQYRIIIEGMTSSGRLLHYEKLLSKDNLVTHIDQLKH